MVVKYNSEQLHMMELLRWYCGKRIFYANPAFNNFAYFFYKFNLFRVGTLNKINIFYLCRPRPILISLFFLSEIECLALAELVLSMY